ncbi:MAG TPA: hypothetical protein VFY71_07570 [Planctomycetota bacterium]|nr:hypothetical protein [Planctomycetota bacterium]
MLTWPVLVALVLGMPLAAQDAGSFGALALSETPTPLLAGHLTLQLPAGAVVQARSDGIMAAPQPEASETRVVIDVGDMRMVLMADELFRSAPEDLVAAVESYAAPLRETHAPLAVEAQRASEGLRTVVVRPGSVDITEKAVPLAWIFVAQGDGLLQQLAFYVNPAGAQDLPSARDLVSRIVATLRPGTQHAAPASRSEDLGGEGTRTLRIELPADMGFVRQQGVDFVVHHMPVIVPLGQEGGSLGIYAGSAPDKPDETATRRGALLLEHTVQWLLSEQKQGDVSAWVAEVQLPHPIHEDQILHVFINASTPELRDRLMKVAGTLSVKE